MKKRTADQYDAHVEHPRYGKAPVFTGFDPDSDSRSVQLHWNTWGLTPSQRGCEESTRLLGDRRVVPGTAIEADLSRQTLATIPVTHYYDIDKVCRDCGRRFIFFAREQQHWYEELGFPLEADAVRCPSCRKRLQHIARRRERYEELSHKGDRSLDETLEMVECSLTLIEEAVFNRRQTERVRMLLKRVPEEARSDERYLELVGRVRAVEGATKIEDNGSATT